MTYHATLVQDCSNFDAATWQTFRRAQAAKSVGSSDIYTILFGERLKWVETRLGAREPFAGNAYTAMGSAAEEHTLHAFAQANSDEVFDFNTAKHTVAHPHHPLLTCTLDARATHAATGREVIVEAKWTAGWNRDSVEILCNFGPSAAMGTYAFRAWVQVQQQLAVTGLEGAYIVWMLGGDALAQALLGLEVPERDILWGYFPRDNEMIATIETEVPAFWERHVVGEELPPPGPTEDDMRAAGKAYRIRIGHTVEADLDTATACAEYVRARSAEKDAKDAARDARHRVMLALGKAQELLVPGFRVKRNSKGSLVIQERKR